MWFWKKKKKKLEENKPINLDNYKCSICNKTHKVYRYMRIDIPHAINNIQENERKNRVKSLAGTFILNDTGETFITNSQTYVFAAPTVILVHAFLAGVGLPFLSRYHNVRSDLLRSRNVYFVFWFEEDVSSSTFPTVCVQSTSS